MAQEIYESEIGNQYKSYIPAAIAIIGAICMLGLKLQMGASFVSDGALMMIALASYLFAALFQLTNLYAPSEMARKIGLWTAVAGVFFNLSSWLVRWVAAYDREIAMLQNIVKDRKSQLDSATIATIERNLQIIDAAIAQSKAALARDPASRMLGEQLTHALDKKVELLRTAAMLPAST